MAVLVCYGLHYVVVVCCFTVLTYELRSMQMNFKHTGVRTVIKLPLL